MVCYLLRPRRKYGTDNWKRIAKVGFYSWSSYNLLTCQRLHLMAKEKGFQSKRTAHSWIHHIEQSEDVFRYQALYPHATSWFQRHPLTRGQRMLDVCCGQGASTRLAGEAYPDNDIDGIDYSHTLIARARQLNVYRPRLSFYEASAGQIPLLSGNYDLVLCMNGIFHLSPWTLANFFRELRRVTKPNASILITSVNPEAYGDFAHAFTQQHRYNISPSISRMPQITPWIIGKPSVAGPKGRHIILGETPFYKHPAKNFEFALCEARLAHAEAAETLASLKLVGGPKRNLFIAYTLRHT